MSIDHAKMGTVNTELDELFPTAEIKVGYDSVASKFTAHVGIGMTYHENLDAAIESAQRNGYSYFVDVVIPQAENEMRRSIDRYAGLCAVRATTKEKLYDVLYSPPARTDADA